MNQAEQTNPLIIDYRIVNHLLLSELFDGGLSFVAALLLLFGDEDKVIFILQLMQH